MLLFLISLLSLSLSLIIQILLRTSIHLINITNIQNKKKLFKLYQELRAAACHLVKVKFGNEKGLFLIKYLILTL